MTVEFIGSFNDKIIEKLAELSALEGSLTVASTILERLEARLPKLGRPVVRLISRSGIISTDYKVELCWQPTLRRVVKIQFEAGHPETLFRIYDPFGYLRNTGDFFNETRSFTEPLNEVFVTTIEQLLINGDKK